MRRKPHPAINDIRDREKRRALYDDDPELLQQQAAVMQNLGRKRMIILVCRDEAVYALLGIFDDMYFSAYFEHPAADLLCQGAVEHGNEAKRYHKQVYAHSDKPQNRESHTAGAEFRKTEKKSNDIEKYQHYLVHRSVEKREKRRLTCRDPVTRHMIYDKGLTSGCRRSESRIIKIGRRIKQSVKDRNLCAERLQCHTCKPSIAVEINKRGKKAYAQHGKIRLGDAFGNLPEVKVEVKIYARDTDEYEYQQHVQ